MRDLDMIPVLIVVGFAVAFFAPYIDTPFRARATTITAALLNTGILIYMAYVFGIEKIMATTRLQVASGVCLFALLLALANDVWYPRRRKEKD